MPLCSMPARRNLGVGGLVYRSLGVGGRYLSSDVLQGGTLEDALYAMRLMGGGIQTLKNSGIGFKPILKRNGFFVLN